MRVPGFDPHIDIAILAKILQKEDEDFFKWYNKMLKEDKNYPFTEEQKNYFKYINTRRKKGKVVNFSGVYGAGPPKISQASGMTLEESTELHKIYWIRNKAVKQIAADVTIRVLFKSGESKDYLGKHLMAIKRDYQTEFYSKVESMWLFNPVSGFWYSLRKPKDSFSTLNQGTGVFCFDTWVYEVRKRGIKISLQYHDEIGFPFLREEEDKVREALTCAIKETNNKLKLNVPLGISIDIGSNYAEAH